MNQTLVYHLNSTFYDKYVYNPSINPVNETDLPLKSMMEFDTNPAANWFIIFTTDRTNNTEEKLKSLNNMVYHLLWYGKITVHETLNFGFVDVNSFGI